MRRYELEDYNTIQPKLTYRSPIIRNKTLRNDSLLHIKEKNEFEKVDINNNKIEKCLTKAIPIRNLRANIQSIQEHPRINEAKEQKEQKAKNKLKKNLSSYDIFVPKNSKRYNHPPHHFTFNDMKKKRRHSSVMLMKQSSKPAKEANYICDNCYNNKIVTRKYKEQPLEKKEILNNTFNKENPFYFQDKMQDIYKDKIQHRIKELEKIQRQALNNLAKFKIENPTNIEKFQKQQERYYLKCYQSN